MQHYSTYIHTDKNILGGKPIIKGTRLSVELLVKRLADGWTISQLYESYPRLKEEHIQAIFAYLYECMQDSLVVTHNSNAA
ncbi:MAG: DUF433 domain-containing protein [Bacteroidia bacterium]